MGVFSFDEKPRPDLSADIPEVADFGLDINAGAIGLEVLLAPGVNDVIAGGDDIRVLIISNVVRLNPHILCRDNDIACSPRNVSFLRLGICMDFDLVLLCPEKKENSEGDVKHSVSIARVSAPAVGARQRSFYGAKDQANSHFH